MIKIYILPTYYFCHQKNSRIYSTSIVHVHGHPCFYSSNPLNLEWMLILKMMMAYSECIVFELRNVTCVDFIQTKQ